MITVEDLQVTEISILVGRLGLEPRTYGLKAARVRVPGFGIALRFVADPQLDRVDAKGGGELVHRHLRAAHARALPGRPPPRRYRDVEPGEPAPIRTLSHSRASR